MNPATHVHGYLFAASGIWLLLSPYVLFSQENLTSGKAVEATLSTMSMGFIALLIAGIDQRYHAPLRAVLGIALGVATIGGPWVLGFADQYLAAANASILGVVIVSIAVVEFLHDGRDHS